MSNPSTEYQRISLADWIKTQPAGKWVCYSVNSGKFIPTRTRHFLVDGKIHRPNKPAIIVQDMFSSEVLYEEWWIDNKPIKTKRHPNYYKAEGVNLKKKIGVIEQYYEDPEDPSVYLPTIYDMFYEKKSGIGEMSYVALFWTGRPEEEGPSEIMSDGSVAYYRKGKLHAMNRAAVQHAEPYPVQCEYFRNGEVSSIIWRDGSFEYFQNDMLHSNFGPARYMAPQKRYEFFFKGLLHRSPGSPAVLDSLKNVAEFWENGEFVRKCRLTDLPKILTDMSAFVLLGGPDDTRLTGNGIEHDASAGLSALFSGV